MSLYFIWNGKLDNYFDKTAKKLYKYKGRSSFSNKSFATRAFYLKM